MKRFSQHLIKLAAITVLFKESNSGVIFFTYVHTYIFSNELLVQKFMEFLMDLDCLSENVSILCLSDHQKLAIICAKRINNICKKYKQTKLKINLNFLNRVKNV